MQRLIDADKIEYENIYVYPTDNRNYKECVGKSAKIREAETVLTIPDNPTNGDMIKALFPYFEIYDNADNEEYPYVQVVVSKTDSTCYRKSWWNAPYKENEK